MSDPLTILLPEELRRDIDRLAQSKGLSAEEFVALAALEKAHAEGAAADALRARAARATGAAWSRVFGPNRSGGEPPKPGDEIA